MSRYPVSGRAAGGYDESLLQIAPRITKADRQQGYSVDVLERGAQSNFYGPRFGPSPPGRQPFSQGYGQTRFQQSQPPRQPASYPYDYPAPPSLERADYYSAPAPSNQPDIYTVNPYKPPKKPWFRTTRGIVIIFIIILVLVGAAVGIALGVTAAKSKASADKKGAQGGSRGPGSSAERGGGAANTNGLPPLPSLSVVPLESTRQPVTSQANLLLTLNPDPAPTAASAIVQTRPGTTPVQAPSRTTPVITGPTPSVDPACARNPTLPSCRQ